jgi:hypothetical protein
MIWAELAERQYLDLPASARPLADQLLTQLEDTPTQVPDATYDQAADPWTAPFADFSFILYAVVPDRATVIILRIVHVAT